MSDVSPSSTRYRALIQLLRTAEDLWNASRLFFARWDLSPSQFNVLNVLHHQPEGLSQSELSRLLIMHRSNATGLVDRLERRGLVQRTANPSDRRAYRVLLTPAGNELLERIYPDYFAAAERVWADLPDSRVDAILAELQDLAANAGAVALLASTPVSTDSPDHPPHPAPSRRNPTLRERASTPDSPEAPSDDPADLRTSDL